jgi:hypothetical protein
MPELIVMLTQNDRTVPNAPEVFEACADSRAKLWGFKEEGLPLPEMKRLYARMKDCGKQTALEVVCYSEAEGLAGAKMAAACGCDLLMGTTYSKEISRLCADHGIRYLPFVGRITGRPSVLEGSLTEMLDQAREALEGGAWGIDLLGYRYTGDAARLNREFVAGLPGVPVVLAGSVNSFARLDEVRAAAPWAFTIGSAFFEGRFGGSFRDQVNKVVDYAERP